MVEFRIPELAGCVEAVRTAYAGEERAIRSKSQVTKAVRKAHVQAKFSLTSRQANAVLAEADGKRAVILELYKVQLEDLQGRLRRRLGKLKRAVDLLARHKDGKVFRMTLSRARQVRADSTFLTAKCVVLNRFLVCGPWRRSPESTR